MNTNSIILGAAVSICLFLAYSVGHKQGLKSAPEYLEAKRLEDVRHDDFWRLMDELETPEDIVCSRIFEMVQEASLPPLDADRLHDPYR